MSVAVAAAATEVTAAWGVGTVATAAVAAVDGDVDVDVAVEGALDPVDEPLEQAPSITMAMVTAGRRSFRVIVDGVITALNGSAARRRWTWRPDGPSAGPSGPCAAWLDHRTG